MAPKKRKVHPSLLPPQDDEESRAYATMPQHGDAYEDDDDEVLVGRVDGGEDDDEEEAPKSGDDLRNMLMEMNQKLGKIEAENEHLRRSIPPTQRAPEAPADDEDDVNWDELLFKDPKAAMKLHGDRVAKKVKTELTRQYEADQSNTRFWNSFYESNADLKEDHDLVLATLNKHFNEIGSMRSDLAQEKLADLTRTRILKYSGKGGDDSGKKRSRAQAEGASEPRKRAAPPKVDNVTSLTSVIKNRRALRYKRGKVA